jgi:hypothetical protein
MICRIVFKNQQNKLKLFFNKNWDLTDFVLVMNKKHF